MHALLGELARAALVAQCGVCGGETRDRDAKWRAGHVVQADLMEERHRGGVAAVFAAYPDLEIVTSFAAVPRRHLHELADALAVEHLKRVLREEAELDVTRQEGGGVVA